MYKIIIEATEQSNRLNVPKLDQPISLKKFLKSNEDLSIVFGDLNTGNKKIKIDNDKICVLIGPEGDFLKQREIILS